MDAILNSEFLKSDAGLLVVQIAVGALISTLTQIAKKLNIPSTVALLGFSFLVGFGYSAFVTFVPEEMKENVVKFAVQGFTFAVTFYQFFLKKLAKKPAVKS
jgi:uncharacterized membrane protein YfcA